MNAFRSFVDGLSRRAKWVFALGVLAILVATAAAMWWALRPDYAVLAGNLKPSDASEIASTLSGWGVAYRFGNGDQSILVPDDQVYATRMKLAAQGIPKGGDVGFTAFKSSDYGVTEFAQQVNYQVALQGELERTIDSMQEVDSSRVHLTIQHPGLFETNQEPSKASVTLHLRPGHQLAAAQVMGIQRLVASAVTGLKPEAVTVLDEDGTVLSVSEAGAAGVAERDATAAKLEGAIRTQVASLLSSVLHSHDFTISVAVQLNYDKVKRVQNRLLAQGQDGNGLLVHEQVDSTRAAPSSSSADPEKAAVTSRDVEYAHGTLQEEIDEAPGHVQRISVGVIVPGTLSADEVKSLSSVISAGIGLDSSRGDRIDIAAIATPDIEPGAAQPGPLPTSAQPIATPHERQIAPTPLRRFWSGPALEVAAVIAVLLLLLGWQVSRLGRSSEPKRLTKAERAATLERLVQWIGQSERTP